MVPEMTDFHVFGEETVVVVFLQPFSVAPKNVVIAVSANV